MTSPLNRRQNPCRFCYHKEEFGECRIHNERHNLDKRLPSLCQQTSDKEAHWSTNIHIRRSEYNTIDLLDLSCRVRGFQPTDHSGRACVL